MPAHGAHRRTAGLDVAVSRSSCSISLATSTICANEAATLSLALDSDKYDEAQALAAVTQAGGSDGLIYFSRRDLGGQCVGLFYPDRAANLIQVRHIDYHWAAGDGMVSVTRRTDRAHAHRGRVWRD